MNGVDEKDLAVKLQSIRKSFGFYKYKTTVLEGSDLNVPKGCIYGLLGPSGCGKTTLLRCVVGRIQPDSGITRVFGRTPRSVGSNIPGSGVGYMPQELALCNLLTVHESLSYFGRIHKMTKQKINERTNFLLDFLNIPKEKRLIKNLSGGQQRRISFAIALLHEPPLLILDEPTVGVDPILRVNIWEHLLELALSGNVTAIITTHYVEEARKANMVALMRKGRILAEDKPDNLLTNFGATTLEDVFLKLCYESKNVEKKITISYSQCQKRNEYDDVHNSLIDVHENVFTENKQMTKSKNIEKINWFSTPSLYRIRALGIKNYIKISRRLLALAFQFVVPCIQIIIFCLCMGGSLHNLNIAVLNEDLDIGGKLFLKNIDNYIVNQISIENEDVALKMIHDGEAWGLIHIWPNFTSSCIKRFVTQTNNVTDDIKRASTIHVRLDMTDHQIAYTLKKNFFAAFNDFAISMQNITNLHSPMEDLPLEFSDPVFGSENSSYFEFTLSGFVVFIIFLVAVGLTALDFVEEIKEGLLDRSYIAGVTSFEVMCSHITTEIAVLIGQVGLVTFFVIVVFKFTCKGSVIWLILLLSLQGLFGMTYGYLISAICQEEFAIVVIAIGSILPNFLLNGVVWPVEALPDFLKELSYFLPHTYAIQSLRSILLRGQDIWQITVWRGYVVTVIWICVNLILTAIAIAIRC